MRMASSTACSLRTGNAAGQPDTVGQMFSLGSSPNALRQPQNSFVSVSSSLCTSSPITVSQSAHGDRSVLVARLHRAATRNSTASPNAGASTWTPTGSPSAPVP